MSAELIVALVIAFASPAFTFAGLVYSSRNKRKEKENEITETSFRELLEEVRSLKRNNIAVNQERIKHLIRTHIRDGKVSLDERQDLIQLYDSYREDLHGNGTVVDLMEQFKKIP